MFGQKIKVSAELFDRLRQAAKLVGATSVDELGERILEKGLNEILSKQDQSKGDLSDKEVENIANKLKGLGYLE